MAEARKCCLALFVVVVLFCVTMISSAPAELHDYYPKLVPKAAECISPSDQQHPTASDHQPVTVPRGPSDPATQENSTGKLQPPGPTPLLTPSLGDSRTSSSASGSGKPLGTDGKTASGSGDSSVGHRVRITTAIPRPLATPVGRDTSSTHDSDVEVGRVADVTFWTGQVGRDGQDHAGPTTDDPTQGNKGRPTDQETQGSLAQNASQQGGQEGSKGNENNVGRVHPGGREAQEGSIRKDNEVNLGGQVSGQVTPSDHGSTPGKGEASTVSNTGDWPAPKTSPGAENVSGPCSTTESCSAGTGGINVIIITTTTTTTTTPTTTNGFDSAGLESDMTTPDTEIPQDPAARREYMRKVKENATASPSDLSLPDEAGISNASDDKTIVDKPTEHVDGLDLGYRVTDSSPGDSSITMTTTTERVALVGESSVSESGSASSGGSRSRVNGTGVSGTVGSDGLDSGSRVSGTFSSGSSGSGNLDSGSSVNGRASSSGMAGSEGSGNGRHVSGNGSGNMLPSPEDTISMIPSDPEERRRYLQGVRSKTPSDPFSRKVFVLLRDGRIPTDPTQRRRFLENHLSH